MALKGRRPSPMSDIVLEFLLPSVDRVGSLRFFDRAPIDQSQELESYAVQIVNQDLSATIRVWAGYELSSPMAFFQEMAEPSHGWEGDLTWESLEGELALAATHDGLGHIRVSVGLKSGHMPDDWHVRGCVRTEAGLLSSHAHHAAKFFGRTNSSFETSPAN